MLRLELSPGEEKLLLEIVSTELSNLDTEILKTDDFDFKNSLKERRESIQRIFEALKLENQNQSNAEYGVNQFWS